ncbi:MAG: efflux transporter outer membrane subunit [Pseudomonadota bacterium]
MTYRLLIIHLSLLLTSGCATNPKAVAPTATPDSWQTPVSAGEQLPDLWALTDCAALHTLMRRALAQNPDLQTTVLRVEEAQTLLRSSRSVLWPSLDLSGSAGRQRFAGSTSSSGSWALISGWEADLWGRLRAQVTSSQYTLSISQADLAAARNSLAANVIRTLLDVLTLKQTLQIDQRRIASSTLNESFIRERYLAGLGSLADLEAARTILQQQRAQRFDREASLAQTQRALKVFLGDYDVSLRLPERVEVVLPVEPVPLNVMAARPDIQAAYARIQAAHADATSAQRARLPSLSLVLDHTRSGTSPAQALSIAGISNLIADAALPIFRGGQLRAAQARAGIETERLIWRYRSEILNALREVEDAMDQELSLTRQVDARAQAQGHAANNRTLFEARYRDGLVNVFDLLDAQQTYYDAEVQLLNTKLQRQQNRIDLAIALGLGV